MIGRLALASARVVGDGNVSMMRNAASVARIRSFTRIAALFVCLTALFSPGQSSAQTGLVAAYSFSEGAGTTVTDSSGNGNTGTISGATWTTSGKFGNALVFNGTSAKVTVPNSTSLRLTTGMTLEAWVYPTTAPKAWRSVVAKNVDGYYLMASTDVGNRIGTGGTWTGGNQNTIGPSALTVNVWTHLAATFDGAMVRLFVNGVQVASQAQTTPLAATTGTLQIGADSYPTEFFAGRIDEVRIYNRALSVAEIVTDMNTAVGGTPAPDTTPPSAPAGLTATAAFSSQINLTWSASTDNVGVTGYRVEYCQGAGCANFTQIAALTSTTLGSLGLAPGTSYSYRVRAVDAAGNLSDYSSVVTAVTPGTDTVAPSAPSALLVLATDSSRVSLIWLGSTDNVGVDGYRVERCLGGGCINFSEVAIAPQVRYDDAGLLANSSYSYRVRAADATGNLSAYSNVVIATTKSSPPTPSALVAAYTFNEGAGTTVTDISGNGNHGTISGATWTSSGKFGNALEFNGTNSKVTVPDSTSLRLTTGMTLEAWVYPTTAPKAWRAVIDKNVDGYYLMASTDAGNRIGTGGTWTGGNQNTVGPSALTVNVWTHLAATFDGAMVRLYVNGVQVASQTQTTPLAPTTGTLQIGADSYPTEFFAGRIDEVRIYNRALSAAEIATDMNTAVGTTPVPDTTPPSAPTNLSATPVGATRIDLAWTAATDNIGVTGYRIERCQIFGCSTFAQVAMSTGTTFSDTGLATSASYSYRVRGVDAAGNLSGYSNITSPYLFQSNPSPVPPLSQAVAYQIDYAHAGFATFGMPLAFPANPTWSVTLDGYVSYPLIAGNKVYVTTWTVSGLAAYLYALDKQTGNIAWGPVTIAGTYNSTGHAYDHGKIFLVNFDGVLRSFDAENGQPGWTIQLPGQPAFTAAPTAVNGIIYIGGVGTLIAVDESNGNVMWTASVNGGDTSSPTVSGDGVFVAYPCQTYKFNPRTGAALWHYAGQCSGGGGNTAAYANGRVYSRDKPNPIGLIFDAATGTQTGTFTATPIPAFSSQAGYFLDSSQILRGIDLNSQGTLWSFSGDGSLLSAPIVIDGTVIVASSSGNVYAVDAVTGAQIWKGFAGAPFIQSDGGPGPIRALGAGEGYLVMPAGNVLTGWHLSGP